MCHPGLDPSVKCAATTGPRRHRSPVTTDPGAVMPVATPVPDRVVLDDPDATEANGDGREATSA
jgi:hypothetical protein